MEKLFAKRFSEVAAPILQSLVDLATSHAPVTQDKVAHLVDKLEASSLAQCSAFFDKLGFSALLVDEEDRARFQGWRAARSAFLASLKAVMNDMLAVDGQATWTCISSKKIQAFATEYLVPGALDNVAVALSGDEKGGALRKALENLGAGIVTIGCDLVKAVCTTHQFKAFMLSLLGAKEIDATQLFKVARSLHGEGSNVHVRSC